MEVQWSELEDGKCGSVLKRRNGSRTVMRGTPSNLPPQPDVTICVILKRSAQSHERTCARRQAACPELGCSRLRKHAFQI